MAVCYKNRVDVDVDILLVEYVLNDGFQNAPSYERLLRIILNLPHHPAIILVHVPSHGLAFDIRSHDNRQFDETIEDRYSVIAQYYGVTALSYRDALYQLSRFNADTAAKTLQLKWSDVMWDDGIHPSMKGHHVIADMLVHIAQVTALEAMMLPFTADEDDDAKALLPYPLLPGNYESPLSQCLFGDAFKAIAVEAQGWEWLQDGRLPFHAPPSLFPPSSSTSSSSTSSPSSPSSSSSKAVVRQTNKKVGFVTTKPGSVLKITVDSDLSLKRRREHARIQKQNAAAKAGIGIEVTEPKKKGNNHQGSELSSAKMDSSIAIVNLLMLKSYAHMGKVKVTCENCKCPEMVFNAHDDSRKVSQLGLFTLYPSFHQQCVLIIESLAETTSGEHRLRISGVVVEDRQIDGSTAYNMTSISNWSDLSGDH